MPNLDMRTATTNRRKFVGQRVVTYIDSKGRSRNATVLGAGTTSGLKIKVGSTGQILDNVVKGTAEGSVNCYRAR